MSNLDSTGMHSGFEAAPLRPDPVVEFGRKIAPSLVPDPIEANGHAGFEEVISFPAEGVKKVAVPRDSSKALVTAYDQHAKDALEAYTSLRTRLLKSQAKQGFRVVAMTSVGRAEGKTLTAFNLACCCASVEGFSVLLIDSDLRSRSLTKLIDQLPTKGLADVIRGKATCEEVVVKTDVPNLFVMGAGVCDTPPTELFATEKWSEVIRWSRQHFKLVLVDALSIGVFADFELIAPECDGVLVVVRAHTTSRNALQSGVGQIDPSKLLGIIWNGENYNGERVYR